MCGKVCPINPKLKCDSEGLGCKKGYHSQTWQGPQPGDHSWSYQYRWNEKFPASYEEWRLRNSAADLWDWMNVEPGVQITLPTQPNPTPQEITEWDNLPDPKPFVDDHLPNWDEI